MNGAYLAECALKLCASIVCGFVLGLERKTHNQVVGTRTLILISVSSTLLALLSYYMAEVQGVSGIISGDPTRIAAGVVSGIGFLGGGAILRQGMNVKGLTSAAIIWTAAALGLAIGAGMYAQSALVLVAVVVLLVILEKAEERWFPAGVRKTLTLEFCGEVPDAGQVRAAVEQSGCIITDLNVRRVMEGNRTFLHYAVRAPKGHDFAALVTQLQSLGGLCEFSVTE